MSEPVYIPIPHNNLYKYPNIQIPYKSDIYYIYEQCEYIDIYINFDRKLIALPVTYYINDNLKQTLKLHI